MAKKYKPIKNTVKDKKPKKGKSKTEGFSYKLNTPKPQGRPKQLPDSPLTRKGKTLRQLMKDTLPLFRYNATDVVIKKLKRTQTKSGMPAITATAVTVDPSRPNKTPRPHECVIIGLSPDQSLINKQRRVLVSCNCESYIYTFEYANAYYGAGRIIYTNGEPPVFKNPSMATGMCKHLYALSQEILSKNL